MGDIAVFCKCAFYGVGGGEGWYFFFIDVAMYDFLLNFHITLRTGFDAVLYVV
jgi:hypothetical protein